MHKLTALILGLVVAVSLGFQVLPAYAEDCPPDNTNPTAIEDICNPSKFYVDLGHGSNSFPGLLGFIIDNLLKVAGLVAVGFIILGGFQYITSRGSEEQAETGKKTLTNAIIGLVLIVLSYIIVAVVVNALFNKV